MYEIKGNGSKKKEKKRDIQKIGRKENKNRERKRGKSEKKVG